MNATEWIESGQRFKLEGCVIRSMKPAKLRLAYGDERLEEIRAARETAPPPRGAMRRLLARLFATD